MKNTAYLVFLFFLLTNCQEDVPSIIRDKDGALVQMPYLWKVNLDDGKGDGFSLEPSYVFDGQVLLAGTLLDIPYLYSVNTGTGQMSWKKPIEFESISLSGYYNYKNQIICTGSGGHIYNINTSNGSLKWKSKLYGDYWHYISGIDSSFFVCGSTPSPDNPYKISSGWIGNTQSGDLEKLYTPEMNNVDTANLPWNGIGGVEHIVPTYSENSDLLLFIFTNRYTNDGTNDSSKYGLYNYSDKSWIYQNKAFNQNIPEVIMGMPVITGQKIIFKTCLNIYCLDLLTGNQIWKTHYNEMFSWSGQCVTSDRVFAIVDGQPNVLVCHDLNTGAKVWSTTVSGLNSTIEYLNGVVYFTSMSDGRLYAVDALNGKLLWKIKAPDGRGFKMECAIIQGTDGEKGKVIASTYLNGYCYEAER
jgi:outer membrane protein assembly factor BamB